MNLGMVIVPIGAAVLVVLVVGFILDIRRSRWRAAWEREQKSRLPDGTVHLCVSGASEAPQEELVGSLLLVVLGGYGVSQVGRLLTLLFLAGLEKVVWAIQLIEHETEQRKQFLRDIPPVFRDRVVEGFSEAFASGMANQGFEWVLAHIRDWGQPLVDATRRLIDTHLRRQQARKPGVIAIFGALTGGQGPAALPVVPLLAERFEQALMLFFTVLPIHHRLRQRFKRLKPHYEDRGVFAWHDIDNLESDPVTADTGLVTGLVGAAAAAHHADRPTRLNNLLRLALPETPGGVLIHQVVAGAVVAQPLRADVVPFHRSPYVVPRQPVVSEVLAGLDQLNQGKGVVSADLPVGEDGTSIFDIVELNLYPEDAQVVADKVVASLRLEQDFSSLTTQQTSASAPPPSASSPAGNGQTPYRWYRSSCRLGQPNYELLFASAPAVVDPRNPKCSVTVVRLTAVKGGAQLVDEIVKEPSKRTLPPSQPATASRNGPVSPAARRALAGRARANSRRPQAPQAPQAKDRKQPPQEQGREPAA